MRRPYAFATIVFVLSTLAATDAGAGAQRTFVASYGLAADMAFNCSVAKPCRQFSEAIGVKSGGGEVIVLDSAGYGPATITQSVSIVAPAGVYGGISVFSGDGIVVNAGAADVVRLRGLTINGQGGANGIFVNSVGLLDVADVQVSGFSNRGLNFAAANSRLSVTDSVFADNYDAGLHAQAASGIATVTIHRSRFDHNTLNGAVIATNVTGAIFGSVASNNGSTGFMIDAGGNAMIADCKVSDTYDSLLNFGILVRGAETRATITRCDVFGAFVGFAVYNGAHVQIADSSGQAGYGGFVADGSGTLMAVERGSAANSYVGFEVYDGGDPGDPMLRMSNCSSTANYYGVRIVSGGYLETRQNNTIRGNNMDVFATLRPFGAL